MYQDKTISRHQLNAVYRERDICIALLSMLAKMEGYRVYLGKDHTAQPGWENVIYVEIPTGQISWHFPEHEWYLFSMHGQLHESVDNRAWDGHGVEIKYRRIQDFLVLCAGSMKE